MRDTESARRRSQRLAGAPPIFEAAPAQEQRLVPTPSEGMASEEYAAASLDMSALADRQRVLEQDLAGARAELEELRTLLTGVPDLVDRATRIVTVLEEAHAAYSKKRGKAKGPAKKAARKK